MAQLLRFITAEAAEAAVDILVHQVKECELVPWLYAEILSVRTIIFGEIKLV